MASLAHPGLLSIWENRHLHPYPHRHPPLDHDLMYILVYRIRMVQMSRWNGVDQK